MAHFLSAAWIDELDQAASGSDILHAVTRGHHLVLQQSVSRGDAEPVVYHVDLDDGGARVRPGTAVSPDICFDTDYETAAAVSAGRESAQAAFMRGRLRMQGDMASLLASHDLLAALDDVFHRVRETTSY